MGQQIQVFELEHLGVRVICSFQQTEEQTLEKNAMPCLHNHAFYELHVIEAGTCMLQTQEAVYSLGCGQFCLISPEVYHAPKRENSWYQRFCISFELLKQAAPCKEWLAAQMAQTPVWIGDASALLPVVRQLRQEWQMPGPFCGEMKKTLLTYLVLQMLRAMDASGGEGVKESHDLDQQRSALIDSFFHDCYQQTAGEEILAERLGVSRRQLDRILKKLYGKSYRERLMEVRLGIACDLLRNSGLSVSRVSEHLGYSTPSNFIASFKREKGCTPSAYRQKK